MHVRGLTVIYLNAPLSTLEGIVRILPKAATSEQECPRRNSAPERVLTPDRLIQNRALT